MLLFILWIASFWEIIDGKLLRGHGAPVWSLVGSIHFYCHCGHGPVDADLSPRCWLLSSLFRSLSRWVPQPPRCVTTICRRVFSCVPNLASLFTGTSWRTRLLTGLSHATGPASRWNERAIHYPAESFIGHLHQCVQDAPPPPQVRTSPHRMSNLLSTFQRDNHPIRLKQEFRLDLTWWRNIL